jgi:2-polyprenyl-6-methoxyphenol hydroxylase-like FAD-dependent oxidoreductase
VLEDAVGAGALIIPVDLGDGPGDAVLCSGRLTFEAVLWRAVQRQPGVTLRCRSAIDDLVFERRETPRVRGVRLDDGGVLTADLVVDASGRRSPTARPLARRGVRPLPEVAQNCGPMYISRYFELCPGADYPSTDVPIMVNLGWATAMAFPADCRTFCLLAIVAAIDPLRKALTSDAGFSRFHAAIPLMAPWLDAGLPIAGIHTTARVDNRYRRLVDDSGPIVNGLLLLGDAAMHTNPTAGRGVSLAFSHVQHLATALDRARSPFELTAEFDSWTDGNIAAWYQLQAGADASLLRRAEAAVRGVTLPALDRMEQIRAVIIELSKQPGPATMRLRRLRNLVSLPAEVLGDPLVLGAAEQFLARRPDGGRSAGPTRTAFADAV